MCYIGMCRGIGNGFQVSRSLHRVSFFLFFFGTVFTVSSLDRVLKYYQLKIQYVYAQLNETKVFSSSGSGSSSGSRSGSGSGNGRSSGSSNL